MKSAIILSLLQMKKLQQREVTWVVQGHKKQLVVLITRSSAICKVICWNPGIQWQAKLIQLLPLWNLQLREKAREREIKLSHIQRHKVKSLVGARRKIMCVKRICSRGDCHGLRGQTELFWGNYIWDQKDSKMLT